MYLNRIKLLYLYFVLLLVNIATGTYQGKVLFLIEAVQNEKMDMVKWLLEKDAVVDIMDEHGKTPLMFASEKPDGLPFVKILIEYGADPDLTDADGSSAFLLAALNGAASSVTFFKNISIQTKATDNTGKSAVHMAAQGGHVEIISSLLDNVKDVEHLYDKQGSTPVHLSAANAHLNLLTYFQNQSVNLDVRNFKDESTPLNVAAYKGLADIVSFLVKVGANIDAVDNFNRSALHEICRSTGNIEIIQLLIQHNATVDLPDSDGKTPLFLAIERGLYNTSIFLSKHGADLKQTDVFENTLMHAAAYSGNVLLLKYLFNERIPVDFKNKNGTTPLIVASENGHLDAVKILVKFGGDLSVYDKRGITIMHGAAASGKVDLIKYLSEMGVSEKIDDFQGMLPLHYAASRGKTSALKFIVETMSTDRLKQMESLSRFTLGAPKSECIKCYKSVVDSRDAFGRTPIFLASMNGHLEIVKILMDYGGDCKIENNNSVSPFQISICNGNLNVMRFLAFQDCTNNQNKNGGLDNNLYLAAETGQTDAMLFLIENGANVNEQAGGKTVFHAAAMNGHLTIIKELSLFKDMVDKADNLGNTPAWYAAKGGHIKTLLHLINIGAKVTDEVLVAAVRGNHLDIVKYLILRGGNIKAIDNEEVDDDDICIDAKDRNYYSLLEICCKYGYRDIAEFLLDNGLNIHTTTQDLCKMTPLHIAATKGSVSIADLLISRGMDINALDGKYQATPLHFAAKYDQLETIKFLIDHKADVTAKNKDYETPVELSVTSNSIKCLDYFLNHTYDINSLNDDGKTLIHIALEGDAVTSLEYLIRSGANLSISDNKGNLPIHSAINHDINLLKLLLKANVNVNVTNNALKTPLTIAIENNEWSAAKCLLKHGIYFDENDIQLARHRDYSFYHTITDIKNGITNLKKLEC